jgi:tetratricopeptide (TPR) repeat protein
VDSDGKSKIIDFGVARVTDSDMAVTTVRTDLGYLVGTLQYMSPEQCDADPHEIDTRSDVYALGVILFELLCGRLPYDVSDRPVVEGARVIKEQPPTRLGSIDGALRGEIETIALKALEKDRTRRYQSASALAEDLRRFLTGEAITARPPSIVYQVRIFARRNKSVVVAGATAFLILVAGLIVSLWEAYRATRAGQLAEQRLVMALRQTAIAETTNEFLQNMLGASDPYAEGPDAARARELKVVDVLAAASETVDGAFAEEPLVEAAARATLGRTYQNLGLLNEARPHLERALQLRRDSLGDDHTDTLAVAAHLAELLRDQGDLAGSESLWRHVWESRHHDLGAEHPDTLYAKNFLGVTLVFQGRDSEANTLLTEALASYRRVLGDDAPHTLYAMNNVAFLRRVQGRFAESEELFEEAYEGLRRAFGEEHAGTCSMLANLGATVAMRGRLIEADTILRQALETKLRVNGEEHPDTLKVMYLLGQVACQRGRYTEAESLLRRTLEGKRRVQGEGHTDTLNTKAALARVLHQQGEFAEAESLFRGAIRSQTQVLGACHRDTLASKSGLGALLLTLARYAESGATLQEVLQGQRRALGEEHPGTLATECSLGRLRVAQGRFSDAERILRTTAEAEKQVLGAEHPQTLSTLSALAAALQGQRKLAQAQKIFEGVLDARSRVLGGQHPDSLMALNDLASVRRDEGDFEEAEGLYDQLNRKSERLLAAEDWRLGVFQGDYGRFLLDVERLDDAEDYFLRSYELLRDAFGERHPRAKRAARRLAGLYQAWNKPEEAARWRAKLEPKEG